MTRTVLLALLLLPGAAFAQVSVNQGALDRLQPGAATAPAHKTPAKPAARPAARHPAHPAPTRPAASQPAPEKAPAANTRASKLVPGPTPTVQPTPPPVAVLPPPVVAPARPVAPPTPVPTVPTAAGAVSPVKGGIQITFGAGVADMNAATEAAIRSFAQSVKDKPNADLNVYAYAAGVPDDPSTPRRLSLSRALAVRAILIAEGIVSTRIYPRALGASPGPVGSEGPADRVDLVQANPAAATP